MAKKVTIGFVVQTFNSKGKCIKQEFIAGEQVDWEDSLGRNIKPKNWYYPFEMKQPQTK